MFSAPTPSVLAVTAATLAALLLTAPRGTEAACADVLADTTTSFFIYFPTTYYICHDDLGSFKSSCDVVDAGYSGSPDDCANLCSTYSSTKYASSVCYKALVFPGEANCGLFLWDVPTVPSADGATVLAGCSPNTLPTPTPVTPSPAAPNPSPAPASDPPSSPSPVSPSPGSPSPDASPPPSSNPSPSPAGASPSPSGPSPSPATNPSPSPGSSSPSSSPQGGASPSSGPSGPAPGNSDSSDPSGASSGAGSEAAAPSPSSSSPIAGIVGGVIAGLVLLALLAAAVWFWRRKRQRAATADSSMKPQYAAFDPSYPPAPAQLVAPPENHQDGPLFLSLASQESTSTQDKPLPPHQMQYSPPMAGADAPPSHVAVPLTESVGGGSEARAGGADGPPCGGALRPVTMMCGPASAGAASADTLSTNSAGRVTVSRAVTGGGTLCAFTTTGATTVGSTDYTNPIEVLTKQLDTMHKQGVLLRGRYRMLGRSEQRTGAQGVVRFATLASNPAKQFAVKFFLDRHNFDVEQALYADPNVRHLLPPADDITLNEHEPPVIGYYLPPVIVTERGESLDEYAKRRKPDFFMCLPIVGHLAHCVERIHGVGLVHRDLKPGNVMWLPSVNGFTVIDFGSTARAGTKEFISCTLAYAAPEVVVAFAAGQTRMLVTGALDVWSLGVIFYEFLTGVSVLQRSRAEIVAAAAGETLYRWEARNTPEYATDMEQLGFLRQLILSMLIRDPAQRITMAEVTSHLRTLMQRGGR